MLLDKWIEDISDIVIDYFGDKNDQAALYANILLYKMMNSYVWEDEFKNNKLYISNDNKNYSYIELPEYHDPLDENLKIREQNKFNVLNYKYKNTRFYYDFLDCVEYDEKYKGITDEEINLMYWDKPDKNKGFFQYNGNNLNINNDIVKKLINNLKSKDDNYRPYYALILEDDNDKRNEIKSDLFNNIEYVLYENSNDIEKYTNMNRFSYGNTKEVFGHRYFDGASTHRTYLVAQNALAPVGIVCIFDHSDEGVLEEDDSRWSLSYISVSPTYRNKGIAKELLRKLINLSIKNEKYLFRTDPSDIGQKYLFDSYTNIAKEEYPDFAFIPYRIGKDISRVTYLDNFKNMEYKDKCKTLNELSEKLKETASDDLFYFDRRIVNEYIENNMGVNSIKL